MPKNLEQETKQLWGHVIKSWGNGNDFGEAIDTLMQFAMYHRGQVTMGVWMGEEPMPEENIIVARPSDDPATLDLNVLHEMEKGMFRAYCEVVNNLNYNGKPIPPWEKLGIRIQEAWHAAMFYVIGEIGRGK